jgi:hypothetical protein
MSERLPQTGPAYALDTLLALCRPAVIRGVRVASTQIAVREKLREDFGET